MKKTKIANSALYTCQEENLQGDREIEQPEEISPPMLKDEEKREKTTQNLGKSIVNLITLLFALRIPDADGDDTVVYTKCDECGFVGNGRSVETILNEHDQKNPNCKYPRKVYEKTRSEGTEMLGNDGERILGGACSDPPSPLKRIVLDTNVVRDSEGSSDDEMYVDESHHDHVTPRSASASNTGIYHPTNARYPRYSNRIERNQSFDRWNNPHSCNISEAAEAGLFYPGGGQDLQCFYCGVAVPPLTRSEDAWIEHAKWNARCGFVKSVKGEEFIRGVQEMYADIDIDDSLLDQELASLERNDTRRFRESQLEPRLPQGASNFPSLSSHSSEPQPGPSNGYTHLNHSIRTRDIHLPGDRPVPKLPPRAEPRTRSPRRPRIPKRQVQAREVRGRLDMEWAQMLMKIGYSPELIGAVIAEQMIFEGDDFKTFKDMLMATVEAADMGDSFPVQHYAPALSQNGTVSTGPEPPQSSVPSHSSLATLPSQGSRSSGSNSAMTLSIGARSWSEAAPSPGQSGKQKNIESSLGNLDLGARQLEAENWELKNQKLCKICFERDANMVFVPCGHLIVCENCCHRLNECPICRKFIQKSMKAFIA